MSCSTVQCRLSYRPVLLTGIIELGGEVPCPVDADGNFTVEVAEFSGR